MASVRYHRIVTINYGELSMQLKIRDGSTASAIQTSIINRFGLDKEAKILLQDADKCDVVIDATLPTGTFTLVVNGPASKAKETKRGGSKPWDHWNHELPACPLDHKDEKTWSLLNDEKFIAEMHFEIRQRATEALLKQLTVTENAAVVLEGGRSVMFELYDSDMDPLFRQEHFFRYFFPVDEADCFGVIDLATKESLLFVPEVPESHERWVGVRRPLTYYKSRYLVDAVYLTSDLNKVLKERGVTTIHTLMGKNADSGLHTKTEAKFEGDSGYTRINSELYPILAELRVFKTPKEQQYLRECCLISSQAHVYVMRHIKPGMNERHMEALFKAWTSYYGGARADAYTCICASGPNGAILHYGHAGRPNDKRLEDGDVIVLDMGSEYNGYCTDITRSYPVNGKFTEDQKAIFNAVREAQLAVIDSMKPGVPWPEMHKLAERVILQHLVKLGIVSGEIDELVKAHIGAVFMPHGLGHFVGLLVHDVGGYCSGHPEKPTEPGICYLRTARKLEAGMYITVEPGCYFNPPLIEKALKNPEQSGFLNEDVLRRFMKFGGVRLEDDVLVTEDGAENFTIAPCTTEEIEAVIAEAQCK